MPEEGSTIKAVAQCGQDNQSTTSEIM